MFRNGIGISSENSNQGYNFLELFSTLKVRNFNFFNSIGRGFAFGWVLGHKCSIQY